MFKKSKGFTLIELLIVVAIIGILAALLIPNAMTAMQKAKQKATMKDLSTISTALIDYMTDNGDLPVAGGQFASNQDAWLANLQPFYIKICPWSDQWKHGFYIYTRAALSTTAFNTTITGTPGNDEFMVGSSGRNTDCGDSPAFSDASGSNFEAGLYTVSTMADFNKELVMLNGSWIIGPTTRGGGVG